MKMEPEKILPAQNETQTFKIACLNYPEEFDLDKTICKKYFGQFGKVKRMIFKQKKHVIVVEYTSEQNYFECLAHGGEHEGHTFIVEPFESKAPPIPPPKIQHESPKKKPREKVVKKHKLTYINPEELTKKHKVKYVDNDEISKELAAMSGYSNLKDVIDLTTGALSDPKPRRTPKLNRVWKKENAVKTEKSPEKSKKIIPVKKKLVASVAKKKTKEKTKILTAEQLELLKVIRSQAHNVEDKYKILDARDKLLRLNIKKSKLKSSPTAGTCPDMCPEKERLLREIQHQVSMYEQDDGGRHSIDPNKAVKRYSRSSADQEAPLPHELRPVSVLQLTMNYLMHNIMDLCENGSDVNLGEWFHFLWDRTRGIRKDITQQALCCQRSVELVEQCARFHIHCSARLMGEDPSVFDQKINTENLTKCLQTLKYMYHDLELKRERCLNEPEFRAYIILLNLSDGNFMWEVQKLREELQKSAEIKFALQVYSAFEKRNYVKFFKLIKSTTYLNACILMRYFVQVRVQAIETLIKCFTPPKSISFYPMQQLMDLLFFDDVETAIDFMRTYGIGVNKDNTHFLIDRTSFSVPEFPYVLERSSCVESKRKGTVGTVVNGKEMSPEMYMQMQSHEVYNSFDKDGFIIQDAIFNEIEMKIEERLLDEADSRESTPERKSIVTNIFAQKAQSNINLKRTLSPNIFSQAKEEQNIFTQAKTDATSIFAQSKSEPHFPPSKTAPSNIFTQAKIEPMEVKQDLNIFAPAPKKEVPNIFKQKDEVDVFKPKENIFTLPVIPESAKKDTGNIFAQKSVVSEVPNVFGGVPVEVQEGVNSQNIFAKPPATNIFATTDAQKSEVKSDVPRIVFGPPRTTAVTDTENIFAPKDPPKTTAEPKKGGFTFVLNRPQKSTEVPNIFATGFNRIPIESEEQERKVEEENEEELRILELEKHRLQEEIKRETEREEQQKREQEEIKRRNEEIRRRNEEAAEKRRLEAEKRKQEEIERKKREEQEKIEKAKRLEQERIEREKRLEEERIRQKEEMKRKQEELERQRKEMEERQRQMEIQKTVKSVVNKMVEAIDLKIRQETLKRIRESIKRRYLIGIGKKWKSIAVKRMKKRKAMDCSPIWVNTKTVEQCAKELHTKSQDLTLSYMKRYKYGRPLDIPLVEEQPIVQLNLFHLTYSSLRRRLCEIKEKWHQHIYWKVVISVPDIDEMINGLHKLEETLKSYTNWQLDKYGNTVYIEEHKTVTYCVEKQQGFDVRSSDANAIVFIAKSFNSLMQRRIFENLKDFGIYVKLPVVLILEDTANSEMYLQNLRDTGVVADYMIYSCNLSSEVLPSIIDNGMIFLAKRVDKYPPLEMDTLISFLTKNLCTEIWKKAGSYAKWNQEYNFCMRDPNIVINLHNEGLGLLSKIITNKKCKEFARFPEILKDYLPDKVPDFLPCDYRYFPTFWASSKYENKLKSVLKNLRLPKFLEKWPPGNETDLIQSVSKYCTEVFTNPKGPFLTIVNILKEDVEEDRFDRIIWTEAIQAIAKEKLKDQDLSLPKKQFSDDTFNSLVVVYNVEMLNDYDSSEWFYRNNPVIEGYKKIISNKLEEEKTEKSVEKALQKRKRTLDISLDSEEILDVINKAENILRSPKNACLESKCQMEYLNRGLKDLEESIRVVKRMDEMNLLKRLVES